MPELQRYCGLSGALNSLLAFGVIHEYFHEKNIVFLLFGAGALIKIIIENLTGLSLLTEISWVPVPSVHAVGFAIGIVLGIPPLINANKRVLFCNSSPN